MISHLHDLNKGYRQVLNWMKSLHLLLFKHNLKYMCMSPPAGSLNNSTIPLKPIHYGEGISVGSIFKFDKDQSFLMPQKAGMYFVYIDLNLTCVHRCNSGHLRVHVDNQPEPITCELALPKLANSTAVTKRCWAVRQLGIQKLFAQMTVSQGLENWKLVLNSSGIGIFRID